MYRNILITAFLFLSQYSLCQTRLDSLAWIAGSWTGSVKNFSYSEIWMSPGGGMMIGMSRTIYSDSVSGYEYLRIIEDEKGEIFYVANPSGQKEAAFKLVSLSGRNAVFENAEHDFPQRIIYTSESDSLLHARIEGKLNGKTRSLDFPMKRNNL